MHEFFRYRHIKVSNNKIDSTDLLSALRHQDAERLYGIFGLFIFILHNLPPVEVNTTSIPVWPPLRCNYGGASAVVPISLHHRFHCHPLFPCQPQSSPHDVLPHDSPPPAEVSAHAVSPHVDERCRSRSSLALFRRRGIGTSTFPALTCCHSPADSELSSFRSL